MPVKKKKLKKKELAVRIGRLIDQFSDLNNRLNRVSHDKLNQGLLLDELGETNADLQQRLHEMQGKIERVISREDELSRLLESARLPDSDPEEAEEYIHEEKEKEEKINYISDHLDFLYEQQEGFKQTLEQESQSADVVANTIDDLRRDIADLLSHIRRLEESGSELLVSDNRHESEIRGLQNNIAELGRKLEQSRSEQAHPQQEVTRQLQAGAQTLRDEIDQIRHQLVERGGQQKALESRLLELAKRIGETGARVENQQQDRTHKDELLVQRLDQTEQALESLLADKSRELSVRLDTLNGVLSEQTAKSEEMVNHLNNDLASRHQALETRLASVDSRLSSHIDQQANLPDPMASISKVIEAHKARIEETLGQLRQELGDLHEKYQMLDTDEHEAADWLGSLASGLDQQAEEQKRLEEILDKSISDITRRVDEVKARLIIAERLSKEQYETVREQSLKLAGLSEDLSEQGGHGVALKRSTDALQEDAKGLKESNRKLNEQLETLSRSQQQEEQKQARILAQISLLEQGQKDLREQSEIGMDSLQERLKTTMAQLAEQCGLNEGLAQRLEDLEASLLGQFGDIEARFQQLQDTASENRERLAREGREHDTLFTELSELKAEHQGLLDKSEEQKTFLEAMTTEYGKRQEASEQMVQRLDQLGARVESTRSSGTHQGMAIGGLFLLLLLGMLIGYQLFTSRLGGVERDISLAFMKTSENYLTRQQVEQLMASAAAVDDSADDASLALEALITQQRGFEQRLNDLEQQVVESMPAVMQPAPVTQVPAGEQTVTDASAADVGMQQPPQQTEQQSNPLLEPWQALRERGGYTIQLVGVSQRDSLSGFADKHGLQGELAYITAERDEGAWYVLLHGLYDSYSEASQALRTLPESLKSQQPWVRKMPREGSISPL